MKLALAAVVLAGGCSVTLHSADREAAAPGICSSVLPAFDIVGAAGFGIYGAAELIRSRHPCGYEDCPRARTRDQEIGLVTLGIAALYTVAAIHGVRYDRACAATTRKKPVASPM